MPTPFALCRQRTKKKQKKPKMTRLPVIFAAVPIGWVTKKTKEKLSSIELFIYFECAFLSRAENRSKLSYECERTVKEKFSQ